MPHLHATNLREGILETHAHPRSRRGRYCGRSIRVARTTRPDKLCRGKANVEQGEPSASSRDLSYTGAPASINRGEAKRNQFVAFVKRRESFTERWQSGRLHRS